MSTINRDLLPVKLSYFALYAAMGCLFPYLTVYMQQIGLSASECAIILGVSLVMTAPLCTIVGMISDKLRRHVLILNICCFWAAVFYMSLLFVPPVQHNDGTRSPNNVKCLVNSSVEQLSYACETTLNELELLLPTVPADVTSLPLRVSLDPQRCEVFCCRATFTLEVDPKPMRLNVSSDADETGKKIPTTVCYVYVNSSGKTFEHQKQLCEANVDPTSAGRVNLLTINSTAGGFQNTCNEVIERSCTEACAAGNETPPYRRPRSEKPPLKPFGQTFWLFFGLMSAGSCCFCPISSIIDGLAYGYLGDNRSKFGRQRLCGSIGFGLVAVLSGVMMDTFQTSETNKNYTIPFGLFAAFLSSTAILSHCMRSSSNEVKTGSVMLNFGRILRNIELDILLLSAFISGFMCGVQEAFLFWFLSSIDGPHALLGLNVVIQCFSETVLLVLSGRLIKKFGTNWCLCAAFAAHGLRFVLYSFLVNPWYVLSIEPLQGICYGLLYPAMTSRASELTPAGMHATVQGLFGTLYISFGRAVGAAVGGVLYDNVGPRNMFRVCSGVSFCFIIILLVTRRRRAVGDVDGGGHMTLVTTETHEQNIRVSDHSKCASALVYVEASSVASPPLKY